MWPLISVLCDDTAVMGPVKSALLGALAVCAIMGGIALWIVQSGSFDARADTPHSYLFAWAVHTTMKHSTAHGSAKISAPAHFTPLETRAGFQLYDKDCSACHGGPGLARAAWVVGMNPSPPYLLDAARHWRAPELYWIVANGVKMTGMPAWAATRSAGQIWDLVAFLRALPYLSSDDYARLRAASGAAPRGDQAIVTRTPKARIRF